MNNSKNTKTNNINPKEESSYTLEFSSDKFKKHFRKVSIPLMVIFGFYSIIAPLFIYKEKQCLSVVECLPDLIILPLLIICLGLGIKWIVKRKLINDKKDFFMTIKEKELYVNNYFFGFINKENFKIKKSSIFFYKKGWLFTPTYKTRVVIPRYFTNFDRLKEDLKRYIK